MTNLSEWLLPQTVKQSFFIDVIIYEWPKG